MMTRKGARPELQELINAAFSGRLTREQQERLERWLREDDVALDQLLEAAQLEVDLHSQIGRPAAAEILETILARLRAEIEP